MRKNQLRWLYILGFISLLSVSCFSQKAHADSDWLRYLKKDSLLNTFKTCYAVQEETLWQGTAGEGVIVNNGTTKRVISNQSTRTRPPVDDGLISDYITSITIDETRNVVWIGTNEGLCCCDMEGNNWKRFTESNVLPNNVIRCLTMDNGGNLWVGTPSGIAMFDGENWKKFDESNGLRQASIHSIKAKGTAVWVGSVGGTVSRYKDGQWKLFVDFD